MFLFAYKPVLFAADCSKGTWRLIKSAKSYLFVVVHQKYSIPPPLGLIDSQ